MLKSSPAKFYYTNFKVSYMCSSFDFIIVLNLILLSCFAILAVMTCDTIKKYLKF